MRSSLLGRFVVGLVVATLGSACGGKKIEADAAVASPTAAATVAAAVDIAVAVPPDTTVAAPEAAEETTAHPIDPTDSAAPGTPEAGAVGEDATPAEDAAAAAEGDAQAVAHTDDAVNTTVGTEKTFAQMSDEERKDFMKKVVLPKVRPAFQKVEPKEFAKMNCATCHGPNARETKFEMPNPKLLKLPSTPAGWKKLAEKEGKMMKFMKEELTPMMAELLHEAPFDPKTGKGFGCFECHTKE